MVKALNHAQRKIDLKMVNKRLKAKLMRKSRAFCTHLTDRKLRSIAVFSKSQALRGIAAISLTLGQCNAFSFNPVRQTAVQRRQASVDRGRIEMRGSGQL
jgi:hypothetical protein